MVVEQFNRLSEGMCFLDRVDSAPVDIEQALHE